MDNRLAIILGVLIAAGILYDLVASGGANIVFLLKKFTDLIEYVAFWR